MKNKLNNEIIKGIEIREKIKLETINWLATDWLPPARLAKIGIALSGGTALCIIIIKATSYSGWININKPKKISGKIIFFIDTNFIISDR